MRRKSKYSSGLFHFSLVYFASMGYNRIKRNTRPFGDVMVSTGVLTIGIAIHSGNCEKTAKP